MWTRKQVSPVEKTSFRSELHEGYLVFFLPDNKQGGDVVLVVTLFTVICWMYSTFTPRVLKRGWLTPAVQSAGLDRAVSCPMLTFL